MFAISFEFHQLEAGSTLVHALDAKKDLRNVAQQFVVRTISVNDRLKIITFMHRHKV
jgi:hypothetical protein